VKIPRGLKSIDLIVSVKPFYARFYIYQAGYPDSFMQCCSDKPSGVLRVPVIDRRFCVRQNQPQMKWRVRVVLKPDVENMSKPSTLVISDQFKVRDAGHPECFISRLILFSGKLHVFPAAW
jgi:hypothetical protein